jgi:hypothetical protein
MTIEELKDRKERKERQGRNRRRNEVVEELFSGLEVLVQLTLVVAC